MKMPWHKPPALHQPALSTSTALRGHGAVRGMTNWWRAPLQKGILYPDDTQLSFLEELRRSTPLVDRAITCLIHLIGAPTFCGSHAALTAAEPFFTRVPVNHHQRGLDAWLTGHLDHLLHYGKGTGEIVLNRERTRIAALTNLDSRSVVFQVTNDPLIIRPMQRHPHAPELTPLSAPTLLVSAHNATLDRPHGVPLLRSVPFIAQCLRTMENATAQDWKRLGARQFHINWLPSPGFVDPQGTLAATVRSALKTDWDAVMAAKDPETNTVKDLITTGDIRITTIGGDGQPVSLVEPARHFAEQLICVTGLPAWLLGFHWSSTERMASQQSELLVSIIEGFRREIDPAIDRLVELFNATHGRDMRLRHEWPAVTLHDSTETARARAWNAQALQTEIAAATTMWQNGWVSQLDALQMVQPDRTAVDRAQATPPALPGASSPPADTPVGIPPGGYGS